MKQIPMEEKKHQNPKEGTAGKQKQSQAPVQPEKPVGKITSSGDNVRRPSPDADTPPDEQTKGNP